MYTPIKLALATLQSWAYQGVNHFSSSRLNGIFNDLSMKKPQVCLRKLLHICPEMWPLLKATFFYITEGLLRSVWLKEDCHILYLFLPRKGALNRVIQASLCLMAALLQRSTLIFYFNEDGDLKVFPNWFAVSVKCFKRIWNQVKFGPRRGSRCQCFEGIGYLMYTGRRGVGEGRIGWGRKDRN